MKKITVMYDGPLDEGLDKRIIEALEPIGGKQYILSFDIVDQKRNINFDYLKDEKE